LSDKVRGKLIALDSPKVALVVRGHVDLEHEKYIRDDNVWTLVKARHFQRPSSETFDDLQRLLQTLASVDIVE
jgi:type III restriction enzyme